MLGLVADRESLAIAVLNRLGLDADARRIGPRHTPRTPQSGTPQSGTTDVCQALPKRRSRLAYSRHASQRSRRSKSGNSFC
ncbi:hypothetical protein L5G28_14755 [Gordonia sp. HY285]|nr:hypothetical protein [Gordonia liuliyuniae]